MKYQKNIQSLLKQIVVALLGYQIINTNDLRYFFLLLVLGLIHYALTVRNVLFAYQIMKHDKDQEGLVENKLKQKYVFTTLASVLIVYSLLLLFVIIYRYPFWSASF